MKEHDEPEASLHSDGQGFPKVLQRISEDSSRSAVEINTYVLKRRCAYIESSYMGHFNGNARGENWMSPPQIGIASIPCQWSQFAFS